ncbi:MAG: CBS domain-containing protein [Candidatus Carbobacillus altaicus]|uniref:Inosine-5'-monophosphate dehydrogenase n=1 Tax=Candidatus Carbonibacillus altaicus TaxID=2163959 RepID=A0A2R6Y1F2_9BACL|nr:CBS domain-containing protein [Candidatus Carbobacillus altaicus]PTQ56503.1 MAG: Inosine-5'-monophosphate dehydrogenase [Candidatus Carbobacillus altaicus]
MARVREAMSARVITLSPNDSVKRAAELMHDHDIGALPVVGNDGELIGIVTDRDIVIRSVRIGSSGDVRVRDVMTPNPHTIHPDASTREVAKIMSERQIRRLPVVEQNRLVGIIAVKDLTEHGESMKYVDTVIREVSENGAEHRAEIH